MLGPLLHKVLSDPKPTLPIQQSQADSTILNLEAVDCSISRFLSGDEEHQIAVAINIGGHLGIMAARVTVSMKYFENSDMASRSRFTAMAGRTSTLRSTRSGEIGRRRSNGSRRRGGCVIQAWTF
jgi:hypothetical protein